MENYQLEFVSDKSIRSLPCVQYKYLKILKKIKNSGSSGNEKRVVVLTVHILTFDIAKQRREQKKTKISSKSHQNLR